MKNTIDKFFEITKRGSTISREIRGGCATFFAMAYIIILNPIILSGKDANGYELGTARVAAMTALVACVMTIILGLVANFPMGIAAGLGLNSVVAITVATSKSASWQDIMGMVVIEGLIIVVLVITGFRKAIFNAIPASLKLAIGIGIGLFIALIGLWDAQFIKAGDGTPLQLGNGGSISTIPMLVFALTLFLIFILHLKKVKSAVLISILVSTIIAFIIEACFHLGSYTGKGAGKRGWVSNVPSIHDGQKTFQLPDFSLFGHVSLTGGFVHLGVISGILLVFSLVLSDFFDLMGTMFAVANSGGLLDKKTGDPLNAQKVLLVDAIAASAGGIGSVSSYTGYIESSVGVADGARTGLAAITTGVLFGLSTFLSPLVHYVPVEATAPALVFVGFLMLSQIVDINWKDITIAIPAFLTIIIIPFSYSITAGIGAGFIAFVILKVAKGEAKKIHPLLWIISATFLIYFFQEPIKILLSKF